MQVGVFRWQPRHSPHTIGFHRNITTVDTDGIILIYCRCSILSTKSTHKDDNRRFSVLQLVILAKNKPDSLPLGETVNPYASQSTFMQSQKSIFGKTLTQEVFQRSILYVDKQGTQGPYLCLVMKVSKQPAIHFR